jgi:hypothetical protein
VVETVLQVLAESGHPPKICDLSGFPWYEIDLPEEIKKAENGLLENRSLFPYI